jgi:hypothetical protein
MDFMRARQLLIAASATVALALAAPVSYAAASPAAPTQWERAESFGGLQCTYGVASSGGGGYGNCTGSDTTQTRWQLNVGCNGSPIVLTESRTGPGTLAAGCWQGVNNVWLTQL